jgi:hypothetical protein
MSQNANSLRYVAKHSQFAPYILRPLSAQCMPETQMERQGLVDRNRLLNFTGRSRKPQMALAAKLGVSDYPSPAGGCLLTDPGYSKRLQDLMEHDAPLSGNNLHLLKFGRHMRLNPQTKIIIGRTEQDNDHIHRYVDPRQDAMLKVHGYPGPIVVIPGGAPKEVLFLAGAICAGYSKAPESDPVKVQVTQNDRVEQISVLPILPSEAKRFLIQ